ncbi:MAG: hypothetical protein ACI97A_003243 [Planctomycetota bacterium]|jgi:hypothetical protein
MIRVGGEMKFLTAILGLLFFCVICVGVIWDFLDDSSFETIERDSMAQLVSKNETEINRSASLENVESGRQQSNLESRGSWNSRIQLKWKHRRSDGSTHFSPIPNSVDVEMRSVQKGKDHLTVKYERQGNAIAWNNNQESLSIAVDGFDTVELGETSNLTESDDVHLSAASRVMFDPMPSGTGKLISPTVTAHIYEGQGYNGSSIKFWTSSPPLEIKEAIETPSGTEIRIVLIAENLLSPIEWRIVCKTGETRILKINEGELQSVKGRLTGIPQEWIANRRIVGRSQGFRAVTHTDSEGRFELLARDLEAIRLKTDNMSGYPILELQPQGVSGFVLLSESRSKEIDFHLEPVTAVQVLDHSGKKVERYRAALFPGAVPNGMAIHPKGLGLERTRDLALHDQLMVSFEGSRGFANYDSKKVRSNKILRVLVKPALTLNLKVQGDFSLRWNFKLSRKNFECNRHTNRSEKKREFVSFNGLTSGTYDLVVSGRDKGVFLRQEVIIEEGANKDLQINLPAYGVLKGVISNWKNFSNRPPAKVRIGDLAYVDIRLDGSFIARVLPPESPIRVSTHFTQVNGLEFEGQTTIITPNLKPIAIELQKNNISVVTIDFLSIVKGKHRILIMDRERPDAPRSIESTWTSHQFDETGRAQFVVPRGQLLSGIVIDESGRLTHTRAFFSCKPTVSDFSMSVKVGTQSVPLTVKSSAADIQLLGPQASGSLAVKRWIGRLPRGEHRLVIPLSCEGMRFVYSDGSESTLRWGSTLPSEIIESAD